MAGQLHDYCKNNASAVMKLMKNLCAELEQYATEVQQKSFYKTSLGSVTIISRQAMYSEND